MRTSYDAGSGFVGRERAEAARSGNCVLKRRSASACETNACPFTSPLVVSACSMARRFSLVVESVR
jgi:hypothetical protein